VHFTRRGLQPAGSDIDLEDPSFRIRVRAQRFSPDMFYVNEFAERIYQIDPGTFNRLFG